MSHKGLCLCMQPYKKMNALHIFMLPSLRHPMTPLGEPRGGEYTDITTSSNVAYKMVKQGKGAGGVENGNEGAEYEVVGAPGAQLPSHPQSQAALAEERGYEVPCPPEHSQQARQASAMNVPPVPQGGGEKGPDEAIYEPIPGDQ